MGRHTVIITSILMLVVSLPVNAYFFGDDHAYLSDSGLKGFQTAAVMIDPPEGRYTNEIARYGISVAGLQERISERIRQAGIKVISFEQALEDPTAALIELKLRIVTPHDLYYSIGVNLSVTRKAPLSEDSGAYFPVKTWSDGQVGGLSQSDLPRIYLYTAHLVDHFIEAYQAQN